ncbi:MAG: hypothetical protein ACRDYU_03860 [Actinomycetes bacterium]
MIESDYIGVGDLAAKFGISPETVRRRVASRAWPSTRFGKKLQFSPAQVRQIEKICERPAEGVVSNTR